MSQEKVDRYKQQKANRKSTVKKQKVRSRIRAGVAALVVVAVFGLFGYSAYNVYDQNKETESVAIDYSSIDDYMTSISTLND